MKLGHDFQVEFVRCIWLPTNDTFLVALLFLLCFNVAYACQHQSIFRGELVELWHSYMRAIRLISIVKVNGRTSWALTFIHAQAFSEEKRSYTAIGFNCLFPSNSIIHPLTVLLGPIYSQPQSLSFPPRKTNLKTSEC